MCVEPVAITRVPGSRDDGCGAVVGVTACGHSSVDGRLGNSRRDCRPGEGYSVKLGFDIRWGTRAGDRVGGGSECPERSRVEPNDPVGEEGEIDVGAVGEKDDGEAVVGIA